MIEVTTKAKRALLDIRETRLERAQVPRLHHQGEEWGLVTSKKADQDFVVRHGGSVVLVVDEKLAGDHQIRRLDVRETDQGMKLVLQVA